MIYHHTTASRLPNAVSRWRRRGACWKRGDLILYVCTVRQYLSMEVYCNNKPINYWFTLRRARYTAKSQKVRKHRRSEVRTAHTTTIKYIHCHNYITTKVQNITTNIQQLYFIPSLFKTSSHPFLRSYIKNYFVVVLILFFFRHNDYYTNVL